MTGLGARRSRRLLSRPGAEDNIHGGPCAAGSVWKTWKMTFAVLTTQPVWLDDDDLDGRLTGMKTISNVIAAPLA